MDSHPAVPSCIGLLGGWIVRSYNRIKRDSPRPIEQRRVEDSFERRIRSDIALKCSPNEQFKLQSRRLDSHQQRPVYGTGAFLLRATSALVRIKRQGPQPFGSRDSEQKWSGTSQTVDCCTVALIGPVKPIPSLRSIGGKVPTNGTRASHVFWDR